MGTQQQESSLDTLPDRWFHIDEKGGWHTVYLFHGAERNGRIERNGNPRFALRTLALAAARAEGYTIERDNEDGVQDD